MEENMYLLICLVLIIVLLVSAFWDVLEENSRTGSELHARNRYAIAEKIAKEFNDKR